MIFTSLEFIFYFLPIALAGVFVLPEKIRNLYLTFCSLFFYAWGEPVFVMVMLMQIVFSYLCALKIEKTEEKEKKRMLVLGVLGNLSILFVYKYLNFFVSVLLDVIPAAESVMKQTNLMLPIGISFFSFQALSYVIDVYRGIPAQKNLISLCLYVSFFPQLIAGPIVRYTSIAKQIDHRRLSLEKFYRGMIRFLIGFNKKVLLANQLAVAADAAFGSSSLSCAMAWTGVLCYTLQIYFDFGGYSDMAIGLGLMFGFEFQENFNYPYVSSTLSEFWRRWHISLGSWFKDYVYFPLGGSRAASTKRLVFNLLAVWLMTGLWHGASWNFVIWGLFHGFFVIFEKLINVSDKVSKKRVLSVFYRLFTLLIIMFGWVLFRAETLAAAVNIFKAMFFAGNRLMDDKAILYLKDFGLVMMLGIVCSLPVLKTASDWLCSRGALVKEAAEWTLVLVQFVLFLASISYLVMNAHNPFIYFNF